MVRRRKNGQKREEERQLLGMCCAGLSWFDFKKISVIILRFINYSIRPLLENISRIVTLWLVHFSIRTSIITL